MGTKEGRAVHHIIFYLCAILQVWKFHELGPARNVPTGWMNQILNTSPNDDMLQHRSELCHIPAQDYSAHQNIPDQVQLLLNTF